MAAINDYYDDSNKKRVKVKVPSEQGGTDRKVYVNDVNTGYYLGQKNNKVYRAGSERYSSIENFISNNSF
ncbi:MAG: hypothetical protein P1U46_03845 [Patescibacteria group bacterium]|nr:hypothetical protein [Patescibacteria group bacterium]